MYIKSAKKTTPEEVVVILFSVYKLATKLSSFDSRMDEPIKYSSTFRAHSLPSLMAHTTSDCPRRISPAVKLLEY